MLDNLPSGMVNCGELGRAVGVMPIGSRLFFCLMLVKKTIMGR